MSDESGSPDGTSGFFSDSSPPVGDDGRASGFSGAESGWSPSAAGAPNSPLHGYELEHLRRGDILIRMTHAYFPGAAANDRPWIVMMWTCERYVA